MIRKQQRVVMRYERRKRLRQLLRRRSSVTRQRHASERQYHLGQERLIQRNIRYREARPERWMGMNHRVNIGPQLIDHLVHRELGRRIAFVTAAFVAVDVDQDDHVFAHPPFAYHRGRREYRPVRKPRADVAVRRRDEAVLIDTAAYLNDFLSKFAFSLHYYR